ncbi:MAG: hypothetical protein PHU49_11635 [Syntrophorhabdaceae bacterium]|nr:hypothetical protein [Syntrophorhabdaceae bacterium]MDD5244656.1 hypothetical protein [Syntrophorhabdaceae bacterium]
MIISAGLFPANTLIPLQRLQLSGLTSPPLRAKPEETSLLAHGVGWFVSLAFIGFVEFTLGSPLSAAFLSQRFATGHLHTRANELSGLIC